MPLDREKEAGAITRFQCLDDTVGRARRNAEAGSDAIDGLMMTRTGDERMARDAGKPRAVDDVDAMVGDRFAKWLAVDDEAVRDFRAGHIRHVLMQRTAEGDVDDLETAADRERWYSALEGFADECEFERVTL